MNKAMPFANNSCSNGVVVKLENGVSAPLLNGSASQKQKKVYAPNLNVVRKKNKEKEFAKKTLENNKKIIASRNNHRKPLDTGRFVQSQGLFSDGAGEMKRLVRNYTGDSERQNNSRTTSADNLLKPKVEITNMKVDKGAEACVVNNLLDCDDLKSLDHLSRDYEPIVLPLSANNKPFLDLFCVTQKVNLVKQEKKCQEEKETVRDGCANILSDTQEILHEAPNFLSFGKYSDEDPFISLIRLPDSFPAKGFSDKGKPDGLADSASENALPPKFVDFNARMFGEGQLGRIIVRQSGRIEVQIGQGSYLLQSCGESTCAEEIMIIPNDESTESEESEMNIKDEMIVLGDIKEHLTLAPSWQQLFVDKMSKKKDFGYDAS